MKSLIVNADDFGVSVPVKEAVEAGHRDGIFSAASLMVGGPEMTDAVERARRWRRFASDPQKSERQMNGKFP